MMSRSRSVARGAIYLLAAQGIVAVGQILYGALTGRVFQPAVFGGFVAALSLQGILVVLTTAGLPSYALRARSLDRLLLKKMRRLALAGGVVSSLIFLLLSHLWLTLLNAETGTAQIAPLAIGQLIAPIATLEGAVLRRERGSRWDAVSLAGSWLTGALAGFVCIATTGMDWSLGVAVPVQAAALLAIALAGRSRVREAARSATYKDILRHAGAVTSAGVVSSLLGQSPSWFIGGVAGAATLGQFSRASTISSLPMTSIASAFVRALAPTWHKTTPENSDGMVRDAMALAATVLLLPAAILAAVASPLMLLWLGPGWAQAGSFASVLAPAAAFGAISLVVQSAAELQGNFRPIREAQLSAVSLLGLALVASLLSSEPILVAWGLLASQLALLTVLYSRMSRHGGMRVGERIRDIVLQALHASIAGITAWFTLEIVGANMRDLPTVLLLVMCTAAGILVWALSLRLNPVLRIALRRGLLPERARKALLRVRFI